MSKKEDQLPPESDPSTNESSTDSTAELEKLKARHDAVHHMPTSPGVNNLIARGQSLEDDWIRRHEKNQAEAAKIKQEREEKEAREEREKKGNK
ncbi:MAG: hypothetical protein Q8T09_04160 [Candidatus Melainabacteria bacterium]|nr:hypothetical protein [Candidatus Melainabacteria bacterium]